ncbi:AMP-binding protein, partial [Streptomyces sp. CB01881]|uniref:AMP-binding protein n=1 Tax=Streptomyces sp. CB01881 TaxID=2078691 RepID=UPI001F11DED6
MNVEDIYPLAPLQRGLLFHTVADGGGMYTEQLACRIEGDFHPAAFREAWEQACARHTVLRTSFLWENLESPVQVVHKAVRLPWAELDWRGLTPDEAEERLEVFLAEDRAQGFDITRAPLLRIAVIRLADDVYELVCSNHHLIFDGWSRSVLFREVLALYEGVRGGGVVLPVVRPYREFVAWLGAQDSGVAEGVWRAALDGVVAPTVLPWDPPVVAEPGVASALVSVSDEVVGGLRELCRRQGVTLGTVVQAAWALLLGRHAGQQDVVFGATVSGRPAQLPGIESMVGLFINTLPVRVRLDGRAAVGPWLRELQSSLVELREFEHTPLTQIQGWSQVPRGTALFESLVVVENLPPGEADGGGDRVRVREVRVSDETDTPLTLVAAPGEGLQLRLLFQRERYDHDGARRLLDQLATVLAGFTAGDDRPLEEVRLLDEAGELERVRALNPGRAVFANAPAPVTSFTRRAAERPDAVALVWGERQFTYRALQARAAATATRLVAHGIGPEKLCAVLVDRSPEQVAAVLAVQLAGGAYLPVDAGYPAERLAYLLTDSRCTVLLTTRALLERVPAHALDNLTVVLLDDTTTTDTTTTDTANGSTTADTANGTDTADTANGADTADGAAGADGAAEVVPLPGQLAYVIYTSGSTGQPKGVLIEHAQAARLFTAAQDHFHFDRTDVWTLFHSLAFDFSVWELWGALIHGARLVLVDDTTRRTPADMARLLTEQAVTILNQTPSAFLPLAAAIIQDGPRPTTLRAVVFGGEALPTDRLADWAHHMGTTHPALINMYGITETTVHVTCQPLTPHHLAPGAPSTIGRPLPDLTTHLLHHHHHVPTGMTGEIHVGGAGLA